MPLPPPPDPAAVPAALAGGCPVCGGRDFGHKVVLWPALSQAWEIEGDALAWINRQQGFHCKGCRNNLRMMALADAFLRHVGGGPTLEAWCTPDRGVRVLEINAAGFLGRALAGLPGHRLVEYPAFDMMALAIEDGAYDVVLHSDTLEHVPDPVRGLAECRRVLRPGGACLFTVPLVPGRLTRSREGLPPSYHGREAPVAEDQLVRTEFGSDAWEDAMTAGYARLEVRAFDYPGALVFVAYRDEGGGR